MIRDNSSSSENLQQIDERDLAILSGRVDEPISAHFGADEWLEMNKEVEDAMNEEDSEEYEFDSLGDEIENQLGEILGDEDFDRFAEEFSGSIEAVDSSPSRGESLKRKRPQGQESADDMDGRTSR